MTILGMIRSQQTQRDSSLGRIRAAERELETLRLPLVRENRAPNDTEFSRMSDLTATIEAQREIVRESERRMEGLYEEQNNDAVVADLQRQITPTPAHELPSVYRESHAHQGDSRTYRLLHAYAGAASAYRRDDRDTSYFRDLMNAKRGDSSAMERLDRNNAEVEQRAGWDSSNPANGGTFAPPAWLVDQFAAYARAGRVTADLIMGAGADSRLPEGVASISIPAISAGAGIGVQVTQNTTLTETQVTTTAVMSGIITIAGGQAVSMQQLMQSGVPIDEIILSDLAAADARAFDQQVLSGSGASGQLRGILTVTAGTAIAYTTASPVVVSTTAAASFYAQVLKAKTGVESTLFQSPDAIVMHPRRWAWVLGALDGQSRPLVVPTVSVNAPGVSGAPAAQGYAGELAGLPVYVDPNIPINLGAATNQDVVIVMKRSELRLWESPLALEAFDATKADQASVYFRAVGFSALIADRQPAALATIGGTGLVTPA